MTWQRIEENTYIDDTLVTCAEYQLFIDEMREQGKYYQPDHWTSYQFPAGQAREPILGVRHSDAVAFCEWLTSHEAAIWHYRLPALEETNEFPIKHSRKTPLSYWITGTNNRIQIPLIGTFPTNSSPLDFDDAYKMIHDYLQELYHIYENEMKRRIRRRKEIFAITSNDRARLRAISLFREVNCIHGRESAVELENNIDRARYFARELERDHDDDNLVENLFFFVNTLQERISGRSPAFEGIRLVKERIR